MKVITNTVLNTVAASAADIVLAKRLLSVGASPTMEFNRIKSAVTLPALNELLSVVTVTPTSVTASTTYAIQILQVVNGKNVVIPISYPTAASGDTATTICNAYRSVLALTSTLKVTATGTGTLIITALAGYPLVAVTSIGVGTHTIATTVVGKTAFAAGTSVAATGVFTKAGHGLLVGDTISITASAASTYSLYGATVVVPFNVVVNSVPSSSTFTVRGLTITTDGTGIGATAIPTPAYGTGAQLIAAGVSGAVAGNTYYDYVFDYTDQGTISAGNTMEAHPRQSNIYVNVTTNFPAFDAQMILTQGAVTSGTIVNAQALALA